MATWKTTAPEADARLVEWHHERHTGTSGTIVLIREWPNVDAEVGKTLAAAWSATVAAPLADGQIYSGTFNVQPFNSGEQNRSNTLRQTLVLPDATGFTITYLENCDMQVAVTYYFDMTLTAFLLLDDAYSSSTDGVTVAIRGGRNSRGFWDVTVTVRTRQYRTYGTTPGVFSGGVLERETVFDERREWKQLGLTTQAKRDITRADGSRPDRRADLQLDRRLVPEARAEVRQDRRRQRQGSRVQGVDRDEVSSGADRMLLYFESYRGAVASGSGLAPADGRRDRLRDEEWSLS